MSTTTATAELAALNARRKALLLELASVNARIDEACEKLVKPAPVAAPAGVLAGLRALKAEADRTMRLVPEAAIEEVIGDCDKDELVALAKALGTVRRVATASA